MLKRVQMWVLMFLLISRQQSRFITLHYEEMSLSSSQVKKRLKSVKNVWLNEAGIADCVTVNSGLSPCMPLFKWLIDSHSNLPYTEQKKVFQQTPRGFRKVILSTGMAETSISIDGVTCVVDSGFETVQMYVQWLSDNHRFDKNVSINTHVIQPISKVRYWGLLEYRLLLNNEQDERVDLLKEIAFDYILKMIIRN